MMPGSTPHQHVRVSAKAIIVVADEILLVEIQDEAGSYFLLPGGGQERGESLVVTLSRECLEEIGTEVEVEDLLLVRDYIEENHEFVGRKTGFHQVELMFRCRIPAGNRARLGGTPDARQVGVRWVPLRDLGAVRIYPKCLGREIVRVLRGDKGKIYLGDVN